MQLARTENGEHHQLVEVRPAATDADLLAYRGAAAVAAHHVIGLEDLPAAATLLDDADAHAAGILLDRLRRPAEMTFNAGQPGHFPAQHLFHQILRKPLIGLEVIGRDEISLPRRVPVLAHEIAVRDDAADRIAARHDARRTQLVGDAPEIKMLQGALGEVLPFRDPLRRVIALDQRARHVAQAELDGKRHPDRPAAHDHDLMLLVRH